MKKNQENVNIKGFHFAFKVCIPFSSSSMQNNMVNQENSATMGWIDVPVVKSPCCSYIGPRCVSHPGVCPRIHSGGSQPLITPAPETPTSDLCGHLHK